MKLATTITAFILSGALGALSCGGDGGGPAPSSGLPRASTLASLDAAQAGTLCDWTNTRQGGYNRTASCAGGTTEMTDPDRASCVVSIGDIGTSCATLTIGDVEDCAKAIGADLCARPTAPGCANFNACLDSL